MKIRTALIAALALAGCTKDLQKVHPTMESDPPETGAEGFVYMNELGKAYTVQQYADPNAPNYNPYCQYTRESYQEHEKYAVSRYRTHQHDSGDFQNSGANTAKADESEGKYKGSARKDFRCFVFKQPSKDGADVRNYALAGFALSDLYCHNFFRRIALHSSTRSFDRGLVNDVGAAIAGVLGLASAGSGATAGVAVATGLSDNVFRDYDSQFLVSADFATLEKQVFASQAQYATAFLAKPMPASYMEAGLAIQAHANFCSFVGMKALVNSAVDSDTKDKTKDVEKQIDNLKTIEANLKADEQKQMDAFSAAEDTWDKSDKQSAAATKHLAAIAAAKKAIDKDKAALAALAATDAAGPAPAGANAASSPSK